MGYQHITRASQARPPGQLPPLPVGQPSQGGTRQAMQSQPRGCRPCRGCSAGPGARQREAGAAVGALDGIPLPPHRHGGSTLLRLTLVFNIEGSLPMPVAQSQQPPEAAPTRTLPETTTSDTVTSGRALQVHCSRWCPYPHGLSAPAASSCPPGFLTWFTPHPHFRPSTLEFRRPAPHCASLSLPP